MIYGAQLMFIRREQGRANEILEMVEQSVSANPGIATWRAGLAAVSVACGREDQARSLLEQDTSDGFKQLASNVTMLPGLTLYAEAAVHTRNTTAAAVLYERMEPLSRQVAWMGSSGYGHARLWLGLLAGVLGDHEQAAEHLAFACDFHEANDMPLWAARGHLGWAELLAARGDVTATREHATRALELSRAHGYGLFEERAAALVEAESASGA
jgi:tetratricopeptide (TPR) repeat protein